MAMLAASRPGRWRNKFRTPSRIFCDGNHRQPCQIRGDYREASKAPVTFPMPSPRNISISAERAVNAALRLVDEHEQRLRAILESEQAAADEKFQALVDLAHLTGILVREAAEAEAEKLSN